VGDDDDADCDSLSDGDIGVGADSLALADASGAAAEADASTLPPHEGQKFPPESFRVPQLGQKAAALPSGADEDSDADACCCFWPNFNDPPSIFRTPAPPP